LAADESQCGDHGAQLFSVSHFFDRRMIGVIASRNFQDRERRKIKKRKKFACKKIRATKKSKNATRTFDQRSGFPRPRRISLTNPRLWSGCPDVPSRSQLLLMKRWVLLQPQGQSPKVEQVNLEFEVER
jgi:hypothetical protein